MTQVTVAGNVAEKVSEKAAEEVLESRAEDVTAKVRFREPQIEMAHGDGGKASRRLVEGLFAPLLFGASAEPLGDAAHLSINGARIAITTDSFVVKPLSFPGGSIGELAVNRTVNDLAVSGAGRNNGGHFRSRSRTAHRASGS
ncbi:MAG: AIR synthase related protein [Terriglobales bacterium]